MRTKIFLLAYHSCRSILYIMAKSRFLHPKIISTLPLVLIVISAIVLIQGQGTEPQAPAAALTPPNMALNALDVRNPNERKFTLDDLSGNSVQLSDFKGKAMLLNFFATWCPGCREEMPSLERLYQTNKDKGFVVLGVSADDKAKPVISMVEETGVSFPVVLDPRKEAFSQYFVRGIPVSYFLDRQGRIAGMYLGEADWGSQKAQELVDQLLQEPYADNSRS